VGVVADKNNDRRSLERALNQSLFLLVKRGREDFSWQFPQGQWKEGENMRQVAERVIERTIGPHKNYFVGNAPIGVHCYKYPEELQQKRKQYGAKVFFFRAQFVSGAVQLERRLYKDHVWVTKDELGEFFEDKSFADFANKML
jgi:large subunit ribosomal protein L46